jgi:hypothetical protein
VLKEQPSGSERVRLYRRREKGRFRRRRNEARTSEHKEFAEKPISNLSPAGVCLIAGANRNGRPAANAFPIRDTICVSIQQRLWLGFAHLFGPRTLGRTWGTRPISYRVLLDADGCGAEVLTLRLKPRSLLASTARLKSGPDTKHQSGVVPTPPPRYRALT